MPNVTEIILALLKGVQLTPNHIMLLIVIIALTYILVRNPELLHGFFDKKVKDRLVIGCGTCIKIVNTISDTYRSKIDIIKNSVVRDQMTHAEFILETMFVKFCSSFKEQLVKKRVSGIVDINFETKQYNLYRRTLELAFWEIKSWVRIRIKENHFADYDDDKFKSYCKDVVIKIFNDARDWLNKSWPEELIIDSAEDFTYVEKNFKEDMVSHGVSIFIRAREISLEAKKQINKLHDDWDDELDRTINDLKREAK